MASVACSRMMGLELILGCMFSGKSSELIKRIRMHKLLGSNVLCITHNSDVRYMKEKVVSHDLQCEDAVSLANLADIYKHPTYTKANVICIEEGQFFNDLYEQVQLIVERDNKHVIVSALDGNYQRCPYEQVLCLIPFAESVIKLNALCLFCKDGTPAAFSKRIVKDDALVLVGGSESYASVCRKHFLVQVEK